MNSSRVQRLKVEPVEEAWAAWGELLFEFLVDLKGLLDKEAFNLVVRRSTLWVVTDLVGVQDQIEVKDEPWKKLNRNESPVFFNHLDGELLTFQGGWKYRELDLMNIAA